MTLENWALCFFLIGLSFWSAFWWYDYDPDPSIKKPTFMTAGVVSIIIFIIFLVVCQ